MSIYEEISRLQSEILSSRDVELKKKLQSEVRRLMALAYDYN